MALKPFEIKEKTIDAKGVKSVRSEVLTLRHIKPKLTIESVINAISRLFTNTYSNTEIIQLHTPDQLNDTTNEIHDEIQRLQSWDWRFGKTLPFEKQFKIDGNDGSKYNEIIHNTIVMPKDGRWCALFKGNSSYNIFKNNVCVSFHLYRGAISIDESSLIGFKSDF